MVRTPEVGPMPPVVEQNRRALNATREKISQIKRIKQKLQQIRDVPGFTAPANVTGGIGSVDAIMAAQQPPMDDAIQRYRLDPTATTVGVDLGNIRSTIGVNVPNYEAALGTSAQERFDVYTDNGNNTDFVHVGSVDRASDNTVTAGALKPADIRVLSSEPTCFDNRTMGVFENTAAAGVASNAENQRNNAESYLTAAGRQATDDDASLAMGHFRAIMMPPAGATAPDGATLSRVVEDGKRLVAMQGVNAKGKLFVFNIDTGTLEDVFKSSPATATPTVRSSNIELPSRYMILNLSENAAGVAGLERKIARWTEEGKDTAEIAGLISEEVKNVNPNYQDIAVCIERNGERPEREEKYTGLTATDKTTIDTLAAGIASREKTLLEKERREDLTTRGLDKMGFIGALFFGGRVRREAEKFNIDEDSRQMKLIRGLAYEQALREHLTNIGRTVQEIEQAVMQLIPEDQRQANRLMDRTSFRENTNRLDENFYQRDQTGTEQTAGQRNVGIRGIERNRNAWWNRLLTTNRAKLTGGTFLMGMAARMGIRSAVGGILGAAGGGLLVGGLHGFARGQREATETFHSGEAWSAELDRALATNDEAQLRAACNKVERLLGNRQNELFRNRSRVEALMLIERHQEGLRRLALGKIARETVDNRPPEGATAEELRTYKAEKFAELCNAMSSNEEQLMNSPAFYSKYRNAILDEIRIIGPVDATGVGNIPVGARFGQVPVRLTPGEIAAQDRLNQDFENEVREKTRNRRKMIARYTIKGALTGGIAGGAGWYLGHLIQGWMQTGNVEWWPGQHGAGATSPGGIPQGPGHATVPPTPGHGPVLSPQEQQLAVPTSPQGAVSGGVGAGDGHGVSEHLGRFANENTMPQQGFQPSASEYGQVMTVADERGLYFETSAGKFYGTDQGAALREAFDNFRDRGWIKVPDNVNQDHLRNLLNFAGTGHGQPGIGQENYEITARQLQAVINHVSQKGDMGIFDANSILTSTGVNQVGEAIGGAGGVTGEAGAAAGAIAGTEAARKAAEEAAKVASEYTARQVPGWLLLAGVGLAGLGTGTTIDNRRRNKEINETNAEIARTGVPADQAPAAGLFGSTALAAEQGKARAQERQIEQLTEQETRITARITELQNEKNTRQNDLAFRAKIDDAPNAVFWTADKAAERITAQGEPIDGIKIKDAVADWRGNRKGRLRTPPVEGVGSKIEDYVDGDPRYDTWDTARASDLLLVWNDLKQRDQQIADQNTELTRIRAEKTRLQPPAETPPTTP